MTYLIRGRYFYEAGTNLSSALSTSKTEAKSRFFQIMWKKKEVLITNPDLQGLNDYWIQSQEHLPPLSTTDWRGDGLFLWRAEKR